MKVVAIKHVPNEPMGLIEDILKEKGIEYEYVRVYETNELPEVKATHIVIMGGPMGVYEEKEYPFLSQEKEMIRQAFEDNIPILGICLGAQLIASALGKNVYPYKREIGWFEVEKANDDELIESLPDKMIVFQWHNDTFDLPDNAKLLYAGKDVRNQAFRVGNAIGLQFHLEVTPEIVRNWVEDEKSLTQDEKEKIISETGRYINELNENCRKLVDAFLKLG
ncbi:type 1 glutamine amidotransferase [Archaeoglobus veneficus]|uniref:Glutamine amidotransferase class-I n=1 Tax=Archaeoglobus veneficus (strain DSM 11195 / SNP6) TaxID=693661 RepID=F2KR83_ARCVS|nr:type 1 glutamine amidotransferase [Archaeoglobus veneficus]AEA46720.1 glutamine amidotransferase class-I [Archaeoglobus veneficus SNP6]